MLFSKIFNSFSKSRVITFVHLCAQLISIPVSSLMVIRSPVIMTTAAMIYYIISSALFLSSILVICAVSYLSLIIIKVINVIKISSAAFSFIKILIIRLKKLKFSRIKIKILTVEKVIKNLLNIFCYYFLYLYTFLISFN